MTQIDHTIWKSESVVAAYFEQKDSRPFLQEQMRVMLTVMGDICRPVRRFLDLGCGDGILAAVILHNFPGATAVLVDHSPPMLEAARNHLPGLLASINVCTGDYSAPGWVHVVGEYAPFDLVVSGFSIHHQPDPRKRQLYAEIFRILQPGGMFINMEHVASPTERLTALWNRIRIDSLYNWAVQRGLDKSWASAEKEYFERPDRDANLFTSVETQCRWLREIGYTEVDCYFKYFEMAVFGGCRP
jgi:tRNA (cmo5U34)-methyltransferase